MGGSANKCLCPQDFDQYFGYNSNLTSQSSLIKSQFSIDSEKIQSTNSQLLDVIQSIPINLEQKIKDQFEVCLIENEIYEIKGNLDQYKHDKLQTQTHYQIGGQQIQNQNLNQGPIKYTTILTFQNISFQQMYKEYQKKEEDAKLNLQKCNLYNNLYNRNISYEKYLIGQFNQLLENIMIQNVLRVQIQQWPNYEENKLQQSIYCTIWMLAQLFLAHQKHYSFSEEMHLYLYQQMLSVQIFFALRNHFFNKQGYKKTKNKILDQIFVFDSPIEKYNVLHYLSDQKDCKSKQQILTYLQKYDNKRLLYDQIKFIKMYLGIYQDIPKEYHNLLNIWEESTKVFSLIQQQQ